MTTVRNAVAQQESARPASIGQVIARLQPELARALPKHLDADRMARLALTLVRKDRNLGECSPESFAGALLTAASLGLEPGVNGEAYLVAYKRECTLIVGYQGMAKLYFQHPLAQHLDAQAVYENDEFDYAYGLDPYLIHKPARGERGEVAYYYAVAKLTTGAKAFVVLSPAEVKALRGGAVGPSGRIPDPQRWMERKTALRQLVKLLPKSTQLNRALAVDERPGRELYTELTADRQQIEANPRTGDGGGPEEETSVTEGRAGSNPAGNTSPSFDPVTGEVDPDYDPDAITQPQLTKLHILLAEHGRGDRDAGLAFLSERVGRTLTSSKELTKAEASRLIEAEQGVAEDPFGPRAEDPS